MISITIDMEMFKNYLYNNAVLITHEFSTAASQDCFFFFFFFNFAKHYLKIVKNKQLDYNVLKNFLLISNR